MAGLMDASTAAQTGLGIAAQYATSTPTTTYPSYVSSAAQSPTQMDYAGYTPTTPMATITAPDYTMSAGSAPTYQGLMGQDYNALQKALYDPAAIAAETAYKQGYNNLNNNMGARGLYGSSIMQNQAANGLDFQYQNQLRTAAANAAAQRYGMMQTDLNQQNSFNKDLYGMGLGRESGMNQYGLNKAAQQMTQNSNVWQSQNTEAQRAQNYAQQKQAYQLQQQEAQRNWANQQQYEQYQYKLAQNQWAEAQRTARINEGLALAGGGNAQLQTNNAYDLAQQQMSNQQSAGYMGAAGTVLGGLLSNQGQSAMSSLYGTISGWLGGDTSGDYTYGDFSGESDWADYWSDYE